MKTIFTFVACLTVTVVLNAQTRIFVTPTGSGNGASWATACNLETAVVSAPLNDRITEIWVQKGTYYPSKMLIIPASVKIYGGFAGTETNLSQRNLVANPTIVDAQQKFGSVFRLENSAELDGFTIQNGNAQNNPHYNGGGVWADENTTIRYCTIANNTAFANGGGIYAKGNLTLVNTVVENNTATGDGADLWGDCIETEILIDYTGAPQEVLLEPGTYTIECWGAQGADSYTNTSGFLGTGGKGAYTKGVLALDSSTNFYVYVGQRGTHVRGTSQAGPLFNNAGICKCISGYYASPGGGASDIRTTEGTYNNVTSLRSRIMVAASGAGAGYTGNGRPGGALIGFVSPVGNANSGTSPGAGTQTRGGTASVRRGGNNSLSLTPTAGTFGRGGNGSGNPGYGGSGGAGYYGGGGGLDIPGSSGSSFISGHPGCDAVREDGTHTGTPIHYSGIKFTETIMLDGSQPMPNPRGSGNITGNSGHGFVRITFRK